MAVYKIYPIKDASLYSATPAMNTGRDAILEVANTFPSINPSPRVVRSLLRFDNNQIVNTIDTKIKPSTDYKVYLKAYIAEASSISHETTIEARLVEGTWNNGTGQFNDSPQTTNGVSWDYRFSSGSGAWTPISPDVYHPIRQLPISSQSFDTTTFKDVCIDVTTHTNQISSSLVTREDDSFMLKLSGSQEFISGSANDTTFKFFSVDTNTIYPPVLEFRWDDHSHSTGSLSEIDTTDVFIGIDNNPGVFYSESINRFRLNVRPEFPARVFRTSSLYTSNHYLPTSSFYAIKDLDTNEYVVEFDSSYTKISCDDNGNYFDVYMNGLQPERYYKLLFKTTISGSTIVKDEDYTFKVING